MARMHLHRLLAALLAAVLTCALLPGAARADHPPVLLIGGTFASGSSLEPAAGWLRERGFDVTAMPLEGVVPGTAAIPVSAREIGARVEEIRSRTGASTVDLVGHSQGALAIRDYIKYRGGLGRVGVAVSLGGPHYGDATAYACLMFAACWDMIYGSSFLRALNDGDHTPGDLGWYHLYSATAVYERTPLQGAVNVAVQDLCPGRQVDHVEEWRDGAMREMVLAALERRTISSSCPA